MFDETLGQDRTPQRQIDTSHLPYRRTNAPLNAAVVDFKLPPDCRSPYSKTRPPASRPGKDRTTWR